MKRLVLALAVGMVLMCTAGFAAAQQTQSFSPESMRAGCAISGGSYFPPGANGEYGCVYPDGTVIWCQVSWTGEPECETIPPRPAGFDGAVWSGVRSSLLEKRMDGADRRLDTIISDLDALLNPSRGSAPDLVALTVGDFAGRAALCRLNSEGTKLQVLVHNKGRRPAVASKTRVEFQGAETSSTVVMPTSGLSRVSPTTLVEFTLPMNCRSAAGPAAKCDFQITLDIDRAISESNEKNNAVSGRCEAPRR